MTAPVTGITPIYGIEYMVAGEPIRYTRQKLERNARQIEAALQAIGALPPSNVSDFLAALAAAGGAGLQSLVSSTTGFAASSGWTIGSVAARKLGLGMAYLSLTVTYTGAGITVPASGDIATNQQICTVPGAWWPLHLIPMSPAATGRPVSAYMNGTGQVFLAGAAGGNIATNEQFQLISAAYRLATP